MTVTIRNPYIRTTKTRVGVAAGATSKPAKSALRKARTAASATVRTTVRPRRPNYRYTLTTIDTMFAAVAEPADVRRASDRRDRRMALGVLLFGILLISATAIGIALLLKLGVHAFLSM